AHQASEAIGRRLERGVVRLLRGRGSRAGCVRRRARLVSARRRPIVSDQRLRVAVTSGALRVPPTYFTVGQLRHLDGVELAFFTGVADVRDALPGPLWVAPGGD